MPAVVRMTGYLIIITGMILLFKLFYNAACGSLPNQVFGRAQYFWTDTFWALGLRLPIPLHIISIGLIVQRKWFSHTWNRISWYAITLTGMWLGAALILNN